MADLTHNGSLSAAQIARVLDGRRSGTGWIARCPVPSHDDKNPSFSIDDGDHGPLVFCHGGCEQAEIIAALRDCGLWPSLARDLACFQRRPAPTAKIVAKATRPPATEPVPTCIDSMLGKPSNIHEYRDSAGLIFCMARYERGGNKKIRPWSWLDERWQQKVLPAPRPVYGLEFLQANPTAPVLIGEGEKVVDRLRGLGGKRIAITWCGGVGGLKHSDFSPLAGRDAILCPDHDDPGFKAMDELAAILRSLGCRVRIVDHRGDDLPPGWDVADRDWRDAQELATWIAPRLTEYSDETTTEETSTAAVIVRGKPRTTVDGLPAGGGVQIEHGEPHALSVADLTEDGISLAFADRYCDRLRYCHTSGCWLEFVGTHWKSDKTSRAFSWARDLTREVNRLGIVQLKKAAFAGAVERFARADQRLACTAEVWDTDAFLLGTPGGVVDLRTGEMRAARPGDFISKVTAVAPAEHGSEPPRLWLAFLRDITSDDAGLIRFLQQIAGYSLTGDVREHCLFYLFGAGGNGKGVFVHTLKSILAGHAVVAAMETFTEARGERHPTELAMLRGARLVIAEETEQGRAWAQARIKTLTGGDPVTARYMRQDFFTFSPTWKLLLVGNHQPILRNVDDATRRRFNIVPFNFKPAAPDKNLEHKLRSEWPAILRWAVDGCLDWQANGLVRPSVVTAATAEYFDSQDLVGQWLRESCQLDPNNAESNAQLFRSWSLFAESAGVRPGKSASLADELAKRPELRRVKDTMGVRGRGFAGIRLRQVITEDRRYADF